MSDLIKREDAINSIYKLKKTVIKQDVLAYCDGIFDALEIVQDLPSADRPQGEWAKRTHSTLIALANFAYCSECGQPIMHEHTRPLWSYCPNCGAKMDGERKESE